MRQVTCFLYVISVIVYYEFMESNRFSFGFNIVTQLVFTCMLCIFSTMNQGVSKRDRLLFYYVAAMTMARAFYTSFCIYASTTWILYNTDVFVFITCVTFVLFLLYLALIKK